MAFDPLLYLLLHVIILRLGAGMCSGVQRGVRIYISSFIRQADKPQHVTQ